MSRKKKKLISPSHVGKSLLVKQGEGDHPVEVRVKEFSPNGKHVRLKFPSDMSDWCEIDEYQVVDVLSD